MIKVPSLSLVCENSDDSEYPEYLIGLIRIFPICIKNLWALRNLKCENKKIILFKSLLYFFSYKTEFLPSKTIQENLDPSYKMDLDLLDCLGRMKIVL